MKTCNKCNQMKARTEFHKKASTKDGLRPTCKACRTTLRAAKRKADPRVAEREYEYQCANRGAYNEYNTKFRDTRTDLITLKHLARAGRNTDIPTEPWGRREVYDTAGGICHHCGEHTAYDNFESDHYVPLSKGGSNLRENIVCSCAACNRAKWDTLPDTPV